jgi:hypothetical protein
MTGYVLFAGREDCTALITKFQLFAVADRNGFLGNMCLSHSASSICYFRGTQGRYD